MSGGNIITISTAGSGINTLFLHRLSVLQQSSARTGTSTLYRENRGSGCVLCSSLRCFSFPLSRTDLFITNQLSLRTGFRCLSPPPPLSCLSPHIAPFFALPPFAFYPIPATRQRCPARSSQTAASRGTHWTTRGLCRSPWINSPCSAWTTTRTPCTTTTRSPEKKASI